MNKKLNYQAPETEQIEVFAEGNFLSSASTEKMNNVTGTWAEDE